MAPTYPTRVPGYQSELGTRYPGSKKSGITGNHALIIALK